MHIQRLTERPSAWRTRVAAKTLETEADHRIGDEEPGEDRSGRGRGEGRQADRADRDERPRLERRHR